MAKSKELTIDPKYYTGRTFDPVLEFEAAPRGGPIQANIGHNGVACIKIVATGPTRSVMSVSVAPYPTPANGSQQRMVSINKNKADFSTGARHGHDCSIQGQIGPQVGMHTLYVSMVAGDVYYVNVANIYPEDPSGGDCRIQVSFP